MAELVLQIDDDERFKANDIHVALNRRRIRSVHAAMLASPQKAGFTQDGLRPANGLAARVLELIQEYKYERLSRGRCLRTGLRTGKTDECFDQAGLPEDQINLDTHMDVEQHVAAMLAHPQHAVFGLAGREVWYGGRTYTTHADLDQVWLEIEARTPHREANFTRWNAGAAELRKRLWIAVDDFDDAEAGRLVLPEYEVDRNGDPVWQCTADDGRVMRHVGDEPEDGNPWERPVTAKRSQQVEWEKLVGVDATLAERIRDKRQIVDIREDRTHTRSQIVKPKTTDAIRVMR